MGWSRAAFTAWLAACGLFALPPHVFPADSPDPLFEARLLYNQHKFDEAAAAAERVWQARPTPGKAGAPGAADIADIADRADLIAARAYLERFRESEIADDLVRARARLQRLDSARFDPRERIEFLIGLGETLYFEESYGAAADVFGSVLDETRDGAVDPVGPAVGMVARDRVIDWWASAVDRDARRKADAEREARYQAIRDRMREELAAHAGSAAASYWLAAAARLQGDAQAAWDSAEAGWARASLAGEHGAALREDLDRLMLQGVLPELATRTSQPADTLRVQWEEFKARWKN
jgi:hypothetical protein